VARAPLLAGTIAAAALLAAAAFGHSWPGRPAAKPPRLRQAGPPPAWVETQARSHWLHFSSYCWRRPARRKVCVGMPPVQERTDLAVLTARAGELLRIHLAFRPRDVHLTLYRGLRYTHYRLPRRQLLTWRARGSGLIALDAKAAAGSASYLIRLRTR
jgi:hypothetical protein